MSPHALRACAAALCLALASAGAAAQVTPTTVARVNGAAISSQALERGFDQALRARKLNIAAMRRPEQVREIKREVLDGLIREELLWQKARREGKVASDADVERSIEQTAAQFKTREAFERRIARDGFDERSYRAYVQRMLSADRAAQALVEGKLVLGDGEIEQFYRANPAYFHRSEQLRLHVLLIRAPSSADPAARTEAGTRIDGLRARLVTGEDFEELARRFSEHPTRPWGGALDPVARGQLAPALEEAAFGLQPGELSAVVETPEGFHLLRLDERVPAATVPLEAARERIRAHLTEVRGREVLDREIDALRAEAAVEILLPM